MHCTLNTNKIIHQNIFIDLLFGIFPGIIFLLSAYDWKFEHTKDPKEAEENFKKDKLSDIHSSIISIILIILLNLYGLRSSNYKLSSTTYILIGYIISLGIILVYKEYFKNKNH